MQDIWVSDIMTREVTSCHPRTLLTEVVKQLHRQPFSCLVVEDDKKPVGIITARDMVTILADMLEDVTWDSLAVENFMTTRVVCIPEDATLPEAVDTIREAGVRHAPVVTLQGELVGLLTQSDIINGYYQAFTAEDPSH